jgi:hypothetical protein
MKYMFSFADCCGDSSSLLIINISQKKKKEWSHLKKIRIFGLLIDGRCVSSYVYQHAGHSLETIQTDFKEKMVTSSYLVTLEWLQILRSNTTMITGLT